MVSSTGCKVISGRSCTVRMASAEVTSGAHSPLITARYRNPSIVTSVAVITSILLSTPSYIGPAITSIHVPVPWSNSHLYSGSVVTPGATSKLAPSNSQTVISSGSFDTSGFSLISGFSYTVRMASLDVASGVHVPLKITRYRYPCMDVLILNAVRVSVLKPA